MPRMTKTIPLRESKYVVTQYNAVNGSEFLQDYQAAIVAFMSSFEDGKATICRKTYRFAGWVNAYGNLINSLLDGVKPDVEDTRVTEFMERALDGVTLNNEPLSLDSFELRYEELAALLAHIFQLNFLAVWEKKRFQPPEDYESGIDTPQSVERAQAAYSQSGLIYTVQSTAGLASYVELCTVLNTADVYDLYETAVRRSFEQAEFHKQAQKDANTRK